MITVWICRQLENLLIECLSKLYDFFIKCRWIFAKNFNQGLNCPCSMYVSRHLCYLRQYCVDELLQTVHRANFDQFLTEVIAKLIGHYIWQYFEQILKNTLHEWTGFIAIFKSFLDHTAPSLIKGKDLYLVNDIHLFLSQLYFTRCLELGHLAFPC